MMQLKGWKMSLYVKNAMYPVKNARMIVLHNIMQELLENVLRPWKLSWILQKGIEDQNRKDG